jgi:tetratricopeptide (TPR) repeat protein
MHYKDTQMTLPEIARELGVDALVEASVMRAGDLVHVAAKLLRARPEEQLWAASYERSARDVLALHGEIARTVAEQVQVALKPEQLERLQQERTVDPEAYQAYLQGGYWYQKGTPAGFERSVPYYEQAVALEPDFVEALAGLANAYITLGCHGVRHPAEVYPRAQELLDKALQFDPDNAEALTALGHLVFEYVWDFPGAERLWRRAIDANPSYALARHMLGFGLMVFGRAEEGLPEVELAYKLDPLSPNLSADLTYLYLSNHQTERAWEQLQRTREMFPDWDYTTDFANYYASQGQYDKAIELTENAPDDYFVNWKLARLCTFYVAKGDTLEARNHLAALLAQADTAFVSPAMIARCYDRLGAADSALVWFERGFEIRDPGMRSTRDLLERDDPRFVAIAKRVGFEG